MLSVAQVEIGKHHGVSQAAARKTQAQRVIEGHSVSVFDAWFMHWPYRWWRMVLVADRLKRYPNVGSYIVEFRNWSRLGHEPVASWLGDYAEMASLNKVKGHTLVSDPVGPGINIDPSPI